MLKKLKKLLGLQQPITTTGEPLTPDQVSCVVGGSRGTDPDEIISIMDFGGSVQQPPP